MSLRKLLILTCTLLVGILGSVAQTIQPQIDGFWGVKLGDTERNVVYKVRQSYPNADYRRDTNGHPFTARQVSLAGLEMDACEFTFKNGIFTKATFNKSVGWKQIHVSRVQSFLNSLTQQMQSDYQEVCDAISSKYGTPKVSGQTAIWRTTNGNSITVKPWIKEDAGIVLDDGTTFAGMGIHIIYSKGSHLTDF